MSNFLNLLHNRPSVGPEIDSCNILKKSFETAAPSITQCSTVPNIGKRNTVWHTLENCSGPY